MKQIFKNRYFKSFAFSSSYEADVFIENQKIDNMLTFEHTFGDYRYYYISYNSLTSEKEFILSFNSYEKEENLNFLFWEPSHLFVLDTGKNIYLFDEKLNVKRCFDITTPLVGLYITNRRNLLILEEASLRLINHQGEILINELFDLIEDFKIDNNQLFIHTSESSKTFELI